VPEENGGSRTGFAFSLARKGSRLSNDRPAGFGSPPVRSGYNQLYSSFGAGDQLNRASLAFVTNVWPNPLRLDVLSPLSVPHGSLLVCRLFYQSGSNQRDVTDVALYADQDRNPDNRNEHLLSTAKAPPSGAGSISNILLAVTVDARLVGAGAMNLFARLSDSTRTRFIYSETEPRSTTDSVVLALEGIADGISVGARVESESWAAFVLETSSDCRAWRPVVTNLIVGSPFAYTQPIASSPAALFFRARSYFE
jgi:hypothetical protein